MLQTQDFLKEVKLYYSSIKPEVYILKKKKVKSKIHWWYWKVQ